MTAAGYVDCISVPLRLPISNAPAASSSKSAKGKQKQQASSDSAAAKVDVVAQWTEQERHSVRRRVELAMKLGYSTVVLCLSVLPTTNPATLDFPSPLFPDIDPRTSPHGKQDLILQLWKVEVRDYNEEAFKSVAQKGFYGFTNSTAPLFSPNATLLSVVATELASFSHVALSLSPPSPFGPTLLTIDPSLSPRLPYPLKRGLINTLIRNGMQIEIVCRALTRLDEQGEQPGDSSKRRRNWVAGAREIVRVCGGKGIVISSFARNESEMRAPADWRNLCSLIGLTDAQAKEALSGNPQLAIKRGLSLRQTFRGVISNPTLTVYKTSKHKEDLDSEQVDSPAAKKQRIA